MFKNSLLLTLIITLLCSIESCSNDNSGKPKIAKTVPFKYVINYDSGFANVQDTIYYQNKRFSGIQFALYPNGDTAFVKPCYEGLEEGISKQWYENKQLAEERFYIAGKKEGVHKGWWPDGKLKFSYEFNDGEFNGTVKEWYNNGRIFKTFHFINGHEEGSQKMWWINGKTRSNYEIRNGRRYGLLGTKNCVNVADSVRIMP